MATKLSEDAASENAKKTLAEEKKASDKSRAEFVERTKGKPTPTQEENDLAALGAHILEHEEDGSNPDPHNFSSKSLEAEKSPSKPQTYQTRDTRAAAQHKE